MSATVIGTIESAKVAQKAIDELLKAGFKDQDVEILEGRRGRDRCRHRRARLRRGRCAWLCQGSGPRQDVLAARAVGAKAEKAAAIIERYEIGAEGSDLEAEETVSEIEENLSVGKNKVASGGVRVTTHVSERPVEETVTLRKEAVEVERRPADRKLKTEEAEAAFQEKTVEMLGTTEEAEVSKEARVVGEVSLGKRVEERKETVKDTVRRTEVEVEKLKPGSAKKR